MIYVYRGKLYGIYNTDARVGDHSILNEVNMELLQHSQFALAMRGDWFELIKNRANGRVDILFPSLIEFSFYYNEVVSRDFIHDEIVNGDISMPHMNTSMFVNMIFLGQEETVYNNLN